MEQPLARFGYSMRRRIRKFVGIVVYAALGAIVGASIMAATDQRLLEIIDPKSEWLGFWGSIIAGGITLFAAGLAFGLTQEQVLMQADELNDLREEKAARAYMVKVMLTASAGRIISTTNKNIAACGGQAHVSLDRVKDVATIKQIMGYDEMWRVDEEIATLVILLDIASEGFNSRIGEARPVPGITAPTAAIIDDMNYINGKAKDLFTALTGS